MPALSKPARASTRPSFDLLVGVAQRTARGLGRDDAVNGIFINTASPTATSAPPLPPSPLTMTTIGVSMTIISRRLTAMLGDAAPSD